MRTSKGYIRIHRMPDAQALMLVSNDGRAIDAALEAAYQLRGIATVDADTSMETDYIAPSNVSEAGDEPHHALYRYRVMLNDTAGSGIANELKSAVEESLRRHRMTCDVTVQ